MAIMIPGVAVSQVSGRVGGTVFSRNKGGQYIKNGSKPIIVTSDAAQLIKAIVASTSRAWADLTTDGRNAWALWAGENPVINRLGQSRTLSGHQAFVQLNSRLIYAGFTALTLPPIGAAPPAAIASITSVDISDTEAEIAFTPTPLATGHALQVLAYPAPTAGIKNVKNRLALVYTGATATTSPVDIYTDLVARFGTLQVGQVLHVGVRVLDSTTGLNSVPTYASAPFVA
jgi:hypothetical protein